MSRARTKKAATWLVIATAAVAGFEGLRTLTYRDPVGIPTACFGETRNIRMGMRFSVEQCEDLLAARLIEFDEGVARCTFVELPPERRAAMVSFAYNVGIGAYCGSSMVQLLNAGRTREACDELMRYVKAKKAGIYVTLNGLVRRRAAEREMCLRGI
jgi:lysozyme